MKRFSYRSLVVSSLFVAALAAAQTRPQYGGTLHVAMRAAPTTLAPADNSPPDSFSRRNLTLLLFEPLITSDATGQIHPALATSWQTSSGNRRWQFHLRQGIKFQDGSALTAETAAASLRGANPSWKVETEADSLIIERESSDLDLPALLALPRNVIVKSTSDGTPEGTGPFHVAEWQPGKKLILAAVENYWGGRPFLDAIEIEMGRSFHDQAIALELGRADLVEVAPEQAHRASMEGRHVISSPPMELVALLFARDADSPQEKSLREALALSVERASMRSVLLQGAGQAAASILPNWMSGYAFTFPIDTDLTRARHLREQFKTIPVWTIGYDSSDPVARLLAERIALNARDAGLTLQPSASASAELRIARIPLTSSDPRVALADVAAIVGLSSLKLGEGSAEGLYAAEQTVLASQRLIPLFHLPVTFASNMKLRDWSPRPDGSCKLVDAWLDNEK
jgi:ABC-type transport system substrate-binding protein